MVGRKRKGLSSERRGEEEAVVEGNYI